MSVADIQERCNTALVRLPKVPRDVLILGVLVLASSASFGLGYVTGREVAGQGSPVSLLVTTAPVDPPLGTLGSSGADVSGQTGNYVASKNGAKYYLPSCAGAKRISEPNKIWFNSIAAAAAAGYTQAAACKGL